MTDQELLEELHRRRAFEEAEIGRIKMLISNLQDEQATIDRWKKDTLERLEVVEARLNV